MDFLKLGEIFGAIVSESLGASVDPLVTVFDPSLPVDDSDVDYGEYDTELDKLEWAFNGGQL